MKLEEGSKRNWEGVEATSVDVVNGGRKQCLTVEGSVLILSDNGTRVRSWPLNSVKIKTDLPDGGVMVEFNGESLLLNCEDEKARVGLGRLVAGVTDDTGEVGSAALAALLDEAGPDDADAERRVKRLGERLARLDALNVAGMLAAATDGGGAKLTETLDAGGRYGAGVHARVSRLEGAARGAAGAGGGGLAAGGGAARADAAARALLTELENLMRWLDAPALRDLDHLSEISLATEEGRARALSAAEALQVALGRPLSPALSRLGGVRERRRRLARAKDALAAALARQLNNALIHLANERRTEPATHHADLLPYAPFMHWLKDMDEKAYDGLLKVYVTAWSRAHERAVRAECERARTALAAAPAAAAAALEPLLDLVETLCDAEQDFCTHFFHLDDSKSEGGAPAETGSGESEGEGKGGGGAARARGAASRRLRGELFPSLDQDLLALVTHAERVDQYGAMRVLAVVGGRVLGEGGGEGGESGRWAGAALAGLAVAAKRAADRAVADRLAALPDAVRAAAKRNQCGVFSFINELEAMSVECEAIFAGGRRADLERWYAALAGGMLRAVQTAEHPRTPRDVVRMENFHRLHAVASALRVPALEGVRREARARYGDALRSYVTAALGRPLEHLAQFFEAVGEAVAAGVPEDEVCYRAAFSKHELRRVLARYPAPEVKRALRRLYRTAEKQLSEEGGLLQVVWRAMQEEFIAQHVALQARVAACYPGAGLSLPLSTQDILDAFSDIAQEH